MDEWFLVDVQYDHSRSEIIWACLYSHPCLGVEEIAPGACRAYFPVDIPREPILTDLRRCDCVFQVMDSTLRPEDWHSRWMESYRSFRVDPFWIRPTWEPSAFPPNLTEVVMDPKGAFGTGTHETTQLCLKNLPRVVEGRRAALDLGCGSGILAIALCKLAPRLKVLALDNDFEACLVCCENRELNRTCFGVACGELSATRGVFDLIIANLQMDLLLRVLPELLDRTDSGALLVVSGLLEEQVEEFRRAYDGPLRLQDWKRQGEWAALTYLRP